MSILKPLLPTQELNFRSGVGYRSISPSLVPLGGVGVRSLSPSMGPVLSRGRQSPCLPRHLEEPEGWNRTKEPQQMPFSHTPALSNRVRALLRFYLRTCSEQLRKISVFLLFKGNGITCKMEDGKEVFNMVYVYRWSIFSIALLFTFSTIYCILPWSLWIFLCIAASFNLHKSLE